VIDDDDADTDVDDDGLEDNEEADERSEEMIVDEIKTVDLETIYEKDENEYDSDDMNGEIEDEIEEDKNSKNDELIALSKNLIFI
jgi:hypothetical protein